MAKFLIDANLPYRFSIWHGRDFIHQFDLGDEWTDQKIWNYARKNKLTVVTKDTDFSNLVMTSTPPPKVIHLKIGNMKINELHAFIHKTWEEIVELNKNYRLIRVYKNQIETIN